MKDNKLRELSTEALLKQQKLIKVVTGTLIGMLLALLVLAIMVSFRQGFSALVIMPFGLLPIVLLNVNSLKAIKKELDFRQDVP